MQSMRQIAAGLALGLISIAIVLGAFLVGIAEGGIVSTDPSASATKNSSVPIITIFPTLPLFISATPSTPAGASTSVANFTATASPTPPPTLTNCPPPAGWRPIIVQPYDTLSSLSLTYRTNINLLYTKNCLLSDQLVSGSVLYVPPLPTSTFVPCGAPSNWGNYTVIPNDTLYQISLLYRISVAELRQANCLNTDIITVGQVLKVPRVATSTPAAVSPTGTMTDTPLPTSTEVSSPTPSLTAPPTSVPATATATIPASNTPEPTDTPIPSTTPTLTPIS